MVALANSKVQYVSSVKWTAVAAYPGAGAVAAGRLCTNTANSPAVGSERVFVCTIAGTTAGTAPTFTTTKGALTQDAATGIFWQECTGQPGVNGDTTNSPVWGATLTVVLGQIIYDSGTGSLQIAGSSFTTAASTPTFSATAGVTSTGQDVGKWTSLGLASSFAAFAAPHARILNSDAATWQTVTPAMIFIDSAHNETAGQTTTLAGGQSSFGKQNQYLSVSSASAPPTSCTPGAKVSTSGAFSCGFSALGYYYGLSVTSGSGGTGVGMQFPAVGQLDNCTLTLGTTVAAQFTTTNTNATARTILNNCALVFGSTAQQIQLGNQGTYIIGGSIAATGSVPTTLIKVATNNNAQTVFRDVDMSAITGTLYAAAIQNGGSLILENCELGAAVAMTSGSFENPGSLIFRLHNCDSGSKNYRFYEGNYLATIQHETTTIDNTNKATDGTTQISWNIATTANTAFGQPYISPEIVVWNDTTGSSKTATIQIAGANVLTNADIWMEVEYLGSASFPIASVATNRVADALTTATNHTTSTDSWGGSPAQTQKMSVSFTPQMKGPVKVRIYAAKASTTVYVNPLIIVS